MNLRPIAAAALLLALAPDARGQDQYDTEPATTPGMVVAPTALPPLGQRSPDAVILARPDVQADLRLTPQQRRRFALLDASVRDRQAELDAAAQATSTNPFVPLPTMAIRSYEAKQADVNAEAEGWIAEILTRPQRARFEQIRLQLDGPMAFARPELIERLNLDDDQAEAILVVLEEARDALVQNPQFPLSTRDVPRRDGRTPPRVGERGLEEQLAEARVSNEQIRGSAFARIARILRKPQWDAYLKLRGAPFASRRTPTAPAGDAPARLPAGDALRSAARDRARAPRATDQPR